MTTRSELKKAVNQDIETELVILNGGLDIYLAASDFKSFDNDMEKLIEIAQALGVDISKYNRKEG